MPEVTDEIRPDDSTQTTQEPNDTQTQDAKVDEPVTGVYEKVDEGVKDKPHPLEPGGERFNQVYARGKDAERKLAETRERLARVEGELEATKRQATPPTPPARRYSEAELQAFIDEGKVTVGQALSYQKETLQLELDRKLDQKLDERLTKHRQESTVQHEVNEYKRLVPEALQPGTPESEKLLAEFSYLVQMGYSKDDPRTEILACRAAFGDTNTLKSKLQAKTIPTGRDTMQDITQNGKPKPDAKDPLKDLTKEQRQHYQRMIDRGVYKGWGEVKEELEFVPPR